MYGNLVVYARGRFVEKDEGVCFYDNDGTYIDSIADLFDRVSVVGRIIRPDHATWDYARYYTHRFQSPNVRPVFIDSWRKPDGLLRNVSRVLPLLGRSQVMLSMGPNWMSYLLPLSSLHETRVVLYNGFDWRPPDALDAVARNIQRRALMRANAVLCTGAHLREQYRKRYGHPLVRETAPLLRFPYSTQSSATTAKRSPQNDEYRVISVGHLLPRKRQEDLLHAVACLDQQVRDRIRVSIVGYGEFDEFQRQNREIIDRLGPRLTFHGHVGDLDHLEELYRAANVMVVTSEDEGFPRTVYEAMMFGVPVISTRLPGLTSVFSDGVDVLFYRSGDRVALAEQLQRLMDDEKLSEKLVETNRKFVARALSKTPRQQLVEILDELFQKE